ncbi:MAG TPA: prolyl oligopeptidase family serine peptidase, partial [Gemmatimonadaceae bacterium]|nr:prolyl oligopeptidase family serine peptidase [Gemmatimonadaceae bacterium]
WHPFESGLMFMRSAREDSTVRADSIKAAAANRATRGGRGGAGGNGGRGGRGGGGGARGGGGAGGGPGADSTAARPDTLFLWTAPFVGPNSSILKPLYVTKGNGTINGVQFSNDGKIMFVNQTVNRQTTTDAIFLAENNATFTVTRGGGGGGAPAGRGGGAGGRGGRGGGGGGGGVGLLTREGTRGVTVVMQSSDGKSVYAPAVGADSANADSAAAPAAGGRGGRGGRGGAAGPRNAIDRIDIRTGTRTRVYETTVTDMTEQAVTPLDNDFTKALATRTNRTTPPESFLVDVASKNATQLTTSKDYWPEITNAIHKTAFAKRPDGVNIRIRVTLPQDWKPGTRLPALFWFYPAEFDSAAAYTTSLTSGRGGAPPDNANGPGTFANVGQRTMSIITAAGYALVENDAPIIATPGKLPNDNYPTDLQWNLEAAVNALVDSGWVDRNRLALGGHSYGAFSTMNGLTLTTLFKAGIAGDGMYNRTLTPNGFQNERRDLWTGQATYLAMSPMLRADKLNGAILMYHSEEDQNVGTDPISSIRMYQALMANGKTASLYMYPYEDHGPVARESNLDQWARWVAWLDKYVKNPQPNKTNAQ